MQNQVCTAKRVIFYPAFFSVDYLNSHNSVSFFRLLQEDKNNLEALRMLALYSLCSEGNIAEVKLTTFREGFCIGKHVLQNLFSPHWQSVKHLLDLFSSLEILEPHNPELFYKMSLAFTRVVRNFPSGFVIQNSY